jgi:broad specificity phosphatase PhoE
LTEAGRTYAKRLAAHLHEEEASRGRFDVWTSTLLRTVQTAAPIGREITQYRELDELFAGICEGMTYAEIAERHPEIATGRRRDKFGYRYPRGESYADLRERLDPVVLRLARGDAPTLVIGHQAVLRVLYAYLIEHDPRACPHLEIPLHTVIELLPSADGLRETRVELDALRAPSTRPTRMDS